MTRNVKRLFEKGPAITKSDKTITGARLPKYCEKLRCFLFYTQLSDGQKILWAIAAKEVEAKEIITH